MVRAQIGDVMVVSVTHPNPQRIVLRLHTQAAADYATELLNDPEKSGWRLERAEKETRTAPDNSGMCPVCGWPTGHCNVGCTASSHQRIKIGDRVRLAIGTNTMLPTDGWTVYKLPSPEWRSYGVKHDNGGDMSINAEYVVPV